MNPLCSRHWMKQDGRIVEQGSHAELMALEGAYARQVHAGETTTTLR